MSFPLSFFLTLNTLPNEPSPIISNISKSLNLIFSPESYGSSYSSICPALSYNYELELLVSSCDDILDVILRLSPLLLKPSEAILDFLFCSASSSLTFYIVSAFFSSTKSIFLTSNAEYDSQNSTISYNLNLIYSVKLCSSLYIYTHTSYLI